MEQFAKNDVCIDEEGLKITSAEEASRSKLTHVCILSIRAYLTILFTLISKSPHLHHLYLVHQNHHLGHLPSVLISSLRECQTVPEKVKLGLETTVPRAISGRTI